MISQRFARAAAEGDNVRRCPVGEKACIARVRVVQLLLQRQAFKLEDEEEELNQRRRPFDLIGFQFHRRYAPNLRYYNQSAIRLAKNTLFQAKTKHIEGKRHFIRERVLEKKVDLKYIHNPYISTSGFGILHEKLLDRRLRSRLFRNSRTQCREQ
ncbi:hypothetical protein MPTK1_5g22400 [Marchantia polymorpha subsp. ruderalis]|uniref:Reverse transcriptase Ty1/copia-type domain-containing protein n=1 Tax=Marchantia polymorpha subsp. ruderalis TaxID=1480154 RepID=A0AAF6BL40_MARPO|nr:hypothetical protein Mp_5g22400 [Marchantia polymorpha subsp. ruderalis]